MPNNEFYCQNIKTKLAQLVAEVSIDGKSNLHSTHIHAESFFRDFLNLIFNWRLINANLDESNAAGIDLIDREAQVIVQVSGTFSKQKIQKSLNQSKRFTGSHFYFVPISNEKHSFDAFDAYDLLFDPKTDILTPDRLCERIVKACDISRQKEISDLVDRYFDSGTRQTVSRPEADELADRSVRDPDEAAASDSPYVQEDNNPHHLRIALLLTVYVLGLLYPLYRLLVPQLPFSLFPRFLYFLWLLMGAVWLLNRIETKPRIARLCFGTITEADLNTDPPQLFSRITSVFGKKAFLSDSVPKGFVSYYRLKRLEFGSWDGQKTNYLVVTFKKSLEYYDPSVLYLHALSRGSQAVRMLTRQGFVIQPASAYAEPSTDCLTKKDIHVFLYYKKRRLYRAVVLNCCEEDIARKIQEGVLNL